MLEALKDWAAHVVATLGYPGVFLLMALDAMNIPIPSEAVMPTAGVLAAQHKMTLWGGITAGSLGTLAGSCASYWVGAKLGKPFLLKHGRWFFMSPEEVERSERWFERHGIHATLWGRFVPLLRTFVSFPAGLFRAPFGLFFVYALVASFAWNGGWAYLGYVVQDRWDLVRPYTRAIEIFAIVLLAAAILRFAAYKLKRT